MSIRVMHRNHTTAELKYIFSHKLPSHDLHIVLWLTGINERFDKYFFQFSAFHVPPLSKVTVHLIAYNHDTPFFLPPLEHITSFLRAFHCCQLTDLVKKDKNRFPCICLTQIKNAINILHQYELLKMQLFYILSFIPIKQSVVIIACLCMFYCLCLLKLQLIMDKT